MLKIKGLKKKKKGKKSKNKDDDLFKPEELEEYRRKQQQQQLADAAEEQPEAAESSAPKGDNDEWQRFNALTAGIDNILQRTQGDLSRIKKESFFQRIPPPSEARKPTKQPQEAEQPPAEEPEEAPQPAAVAVEAVESESEEEDEEDGEDIFDTSFVDVLTSGDVKLAYIPDSPTDQEPDEDPFDTAFAERAIIGPVVERRGKKLVSIGSAVEVLTGRVDPSTCVALKKAPSARRIVKTEPDLLLDAFDGTDSAVRAPGDKAQAPAPPPQPTPEQEAVKKETDYAKELIEEFDVLQVSEAPEEDPELDEFDLLAAESLAKKDDVCIPVIQPTVPAATPPPEDWNAFDSKPLPKQEAEEEEQEEDPFDTTFANNILPGRAELKQIEKEILGADFEPAPIQQLHISKPVALQIEHIDESELNSLKPTGRDLLGGSITDLTNFDKEPIAPKQLASEPEDAFDEYRDPFDTSIADKAKLPGQGELKLLEKELLEDLDDFDFDPRAGEVPNNTSQRPSILKVEFVLPSNLLSAGDEETTRRIKPPTPYYSRENSFPEPDDDEEVDPFDTSFVAPLAPNKVELKLLEDELIRAEPKVQPPLPPASTLRLQESFERAKQVLSVPVEDPEPVEPDLLCVEAEVDSKVLTPLSEKNAKEEASFVDPFDTSIANNILPGKAELKLLEDEFICSLDDPDFDPRAEDAPPVEPVKPPVKPPVQNVLDAPDAGAASVKPLTPQVDRRLSVDAFDEDADPFDTSIAENIKPGRAELKLLETELI